MKQELKEKLYKEFPNLYKNHEYWGFAIDDGWFDLVYELSAKLEQCIVDMPKDQADACAASQIKEKFGGLRYYTDGNFTDEMYALISKAENDSFKICEECGKDGKLRTDGWLKTLCDEHYERRKENEY